jgi:hypothetical protein
MLILGDSRLAVDVPHGDCSAAAEQAAAAFARAAASPPFG